jgi:hypothetical protein
MYTFKNVYACMNMNLKVLNMKYFLTEKKWCQNKTKGCCQCNDMLIMSFLTYCLFINHCVFQIIRTSE